MAASKWRSAVAERSVRFHPEAERDLDEGLRFYLSRSTVAGERFLADVEAGLALLQEAPELRAGMTMKLLQVATSGPEHRRP